MSDAPQVSLILPAYKAEGYIAESVDEVLLTLEALHQPFEILVVCDGNVDDTAARAATVKDDRVRILCYEENRGKGYAIVFGIAHAHGRLIGWLDADLDLHPRFVLDAVRRFDEREIDAVIGSKRHPTSEVSYPAVRRLFSWGFQLLVRILFRIKVRDTQVGAKLFRREFLTTVAPLLLIKRYAFDLEVLAVGAGFGFDRIEEAPIALEYRFSGTSINMGAVRRMFVDTLAIAYRIHLRHWYARQFASYQRRRASNRDDSVSPAYAPGSMWNEISSIGSEQ
jgi:glycosyltransferase involved in cell wall biosynthesis